MKGFLICVALLLGAGIYILNDFSQLATPVSDRIARQEGSVDSVQVASQLDGFAEKYRPFLDQRYDLARVAVVMDDDYFLALSGDTYDRYNNTPLENDPDFAFILFHRAELLNQREHYDAAVALYRQYCDLFPQGDDVDVAKSAISSLRINHGVQ